MDPIAEAKRRPSVHQLCVGAFLQEPLWVLPEVAAIPLRALGFSAEAEYTARYVKEVVEGDVDDGAIEKFSEQCKSARPVISVVALHRVDAAPEELEAVAKPKIDRARHLLAWATGDELTPFAWVVATRSDTFFRGLPPSSRRRQRLGFGNTGKDFAQQLRRMAIAMDADDRFAFALALYHDALREDNQRFKIARLFNCLEALAYRIKAHLPSRKAVKHLLGLSSGAQIHARIGDQDYKFDPIEIAGRIRDRLFHGVDFEERHLTQSHRKVFDVIESHPEVVVDSLMSHCELELARWANGASVGLKEHSP